MCGDGSWVADVHLRDGLGVLFIKSLVWYLQCVLFSGVPPSD